MRLNYFISRTFSYIIKNVMSLIVINIFHYCSIVLSEIFQDTNEKFS